MTFSVHFGSVLMAVKTSDIYIEQSYHIMYASTAGSVANMCCVCCIPPGVPLLGRSSSIRRVGQPNENSAEASFLKWVDDSSCRHK